jgi:hypothetical protein
MNVTRYLPTFPALINFPPIDEGFHIVGLSAVDFQNNSSQFFNDSNISVNSFAGINVQCDANVDPVSISRSTCFVTVQYPLFAGDASAAGAYFPIILGGSASSDGSLISWKAGTQAQTVLNQLLAVSPNERGLLAHLIVKGDFIWSQDDPTLFLDGETLGQRSPGSNTSVALRLPSGDRRRGGDFDAWFWIVAAPSFVTGIQANPPGPINLGDATTITMTLSSPAPASSVITLTLNNANLSIPGAVPGSDPTLTVNVPVPTGSTSATVIATGAVVGSTTISAAFGGQTVALNMTVQPPPVLTGQLILNPGSVFVGNSSTGTVSISGPAPQNGLVVGLASSNTGIAQVSSAAITLPAGATSGTFTVTGSGAGSATISATAGITLSALFTVVVRKTKDVPEKTPEGKFISENLSGAIVVSGKSTFSSAAAVPSADHSSTSRTIPKGAAFIRADERPPVEEAMFSFTVRQGPKSKGVTEASHDSRSLPINSAEPTIDQKPVEKPLTAEKGHVAEILGDRPRDRHSW